MHHIQMNRPTILNWVPAIWTICLLISACTPMSNGTNEEPPVFRVAAQGEGNELELIHEGGIFTIDVFSESGIGSGTVELVSGTPPKTIVIRSYLAGLEQFRLSQDGTTVRASVSSTGSSRVTESLLQSDGSELTLTSFSPDWMDIRIVSDQEPPAIPLTDGYFEISLPQGLLGRGSQSFSIEWVDFFR